MIDVVVDMAGYHSKKNRRGSSSEADVESAEEAEAGTHSPDEGQYLARRLSPPSRFKYKSSDIA